MRAPLKRAWSADGGQVRLVPDKSDKPFYRPQHGSQHVVAELRECWRLGRPLSRWFLLAPSGSFHPGAKYRAMSTGFPPTPAHRCLQMFSEDPSHEISCVVFSQVRWLRLWQRDNSWEHFCRTRTQQGPKPKVPGEEKGFGSLRAVARCESMSQCACPTADLLPVR